MHDSVRNSSHGVRLESMSFVVALKGLVEFAALLLVAQCLVFLISFGRHEANPVYRGLRFLTSPVTRVARWIAPRFVVDAHVPAIGLFLLLLAWLALLFAKAYLVGALG